MALTSDSPAGVSSARPQLAVASLPECLSCAGGSGPHTRALNQLLYLERGRGRFELGSTQGEAEDGDLLVVAEGEVRDLSGLARSIGWAIEFGDAEGERVQDWLPLVKQGCRMGGRFSVPSAERPRWRRRVAALETELREQRAGHADAAEAILLLLLIDTTRTALPRIDGEETPLEPALAEVLRVIDARFAEAISLDDVAQDVARSPRHLSRLVREISGESVNRLIEQRRMVEARRLLLESERPVAAVGRAAGYRDAGYFRRRFRHEHGVSPQRWRQLHC